MLEAVKAYDPSRGKSFIGFYLTYFLPEALTRAITGRSYNTRKPQPKTISIDTPIYQSDGGRPLTIADTIPAPDKYAYYIECDYWKRLYRIAIEAAEELTGPPGEILISDQLRKAKRRLKAAIIRKCKRLEIDLCCLYPGARPERIIDLLKKLYDII